MTSWTQKRKIICDEQSGFRPNHSTQDIILKFLENTKNNFKIKNKTGLILYDFEKAFDTIPHSNILIKLGKIKCPRKIALWIKDYLLDRRFQIQINESKSELREIKAGIPQGGCLSAMLFAIFINDIARELKKIKVNFGLFADDISIWSHSKNTKTIQKKLQNASNVVNKYAKKWGMKINANKTNYCIYYPGYKTKKKKYIILEIVINNQAIKNNENQTLLGITLDPQLKFDEHFRLVKTKALKKFNIIKILSSKYFAVNSKHLLSIYSALIRSLFQYSMMPYIISSKKIKNCIQTLQNKILRAIFKIKKHSSIKILHSLANTEHIYERITKQAKNYLARACLHNNTIDNLITHHSNASIGQKTKHKSILDHFL